MTSTLRAAGTAAASALLLFALAACTGGAPAETPTSAETATVAILDSACADDAGVTIVVVQAASPSARAPAASRVRMRGVDVTGPA